MKYKPYIEGPKITSINMESYMNITEPSLAIHGEIQNTKSVSINGRDLFLNEKKTFSEIIVFAEGLNIIEITLTDTFGTAHDYIYKVYYNDLSEESPRTLDEAQNKKTLLDEESNVSVIYIENETNLSETNNL